jgi:hypothetical protein
MKCITVSTLEEAEAELPSSVLPVRGLRRNLDGDLTDDALKTILDGLKSRGIDPTDASSQKQIVEDLTSLLCSVNNQYQFLMKELFRRAQKGEPISKEYIESVKAKNFMIQDILNVSRHIQGLSSFDASMVFIEGWQTAGTATTSTGAGASAAQLKKDRELLESKSYLELRKQMVEHTQEKNRMVGKQLGIYGFLNLVALGMLIYVAGTKN